MMYFKYFFVLIALLSASMLTAQNTYRGRTYQTAQAGQVQAQTMPVRQIVVNEQGQVVGEYISEDPNQAMPIQVMPSGNTFRDRVVQAQQGVSVPTQPVAPTSPSISPRGLPTSAPFPYPETKVDKETETQGPFFFVDESPIQILKILEIITGKVILQPPNLPNVKINFTCPEPIKTEDAILALQSLLSMNGIAIISMGDTFLKAVPITGVNTQSPTFLPEDTSNLSPSQLFYSKIYSLNFLEIESLQGTLNTFLTPGGVATLSVFPRTNSFMITDTLMNHQRIEHLLNQIDVEPNIKEDMGIIQLKNTNAEEIKRRLANIQSNILRRYFDKTTIEADERTNQLIVITQKGNFEHIKKFVETFDIAADPLTSSEVFYIKHGEAKTVVKALNDIVRGQQQAARNLQTKTPKTRDTNIRNVATRTLNGQEDEEELIANASFDSEDILDATEGSESTPNLQFSSYITIVADDRSNAIVVYGTKQDIKQMEALINKLDIVLLQVKIDVIITEVQLTDKDVSGLSTFNIGYDVTPSGTTSLVKGFSGGTGSNNLNGVQAFSLTATENSFQAVFNIAKEKTNVKVLSSPTVVTTHNKEAMVNVSTSMPIIESTLSSVVNVGNTQSTVTYKDIGIRLTVTPLIGENGMIQLDIRQSADTILSETTISGNPQPVVGRREASSYLNVQSGDVIVLAGLQQNNVSYNDSKVWILGDIPLLGEIFKPVSENYTKSELIMFIRPTIIKSASVSSTLTDETLKNSPASSEVQHYLEHGIFSDQTPDDLRQEVKERQKENEAKKANATQEPVQAEDSAIESSEPVVVAEELAENTEETNKVVEEKSIAQEHNDSSRTKKPKFLAPSRR